MHPLTRWLRLPALSSEVVFDWLAIRLIAEKAEGLHWRIDWHFADSGEVVAQNLENATLTQRIGKPSPAPDASVRITRAAFGPLVTGSAGFADLVAAGQASVTGDAALPAALFAMFDVFQPMFPVVTPG